MTFEFLNTAPLGVITLILTLEKFADDHAGPWLYGGAGRYTCMHPCGAYQAVRDAVLLGPKGSSFSIIFY